MAFDFFKEINKKSDDPSILLQDNKYLEKEELPTEPKEYVTLPVDENPYITKDDVDITLDTEREIEQRKEGIGNAVKKSLIRGGLGVAKTFPDLVRIASPGESDVNAFATKVSNAIEDKTKVYDMDDRLLQKIQKEGGVKSLLDPAIFGQQVIEQLPQLATMIGGGAAVAKALPKLAYIGTLFGAGSAGTMEGTSAYDQAIEEGYSHEDAREIAAKQAMITGIIAVATMDQYTGGKTISKLVGKTGLTGAKGEMLASGLGEAIEEAMTPLALHINKLDTMTKDGKLYSKETSELLDEMGQGAILGFATGPIGGAIGGKGLNTTLESNNGNSINIKTKQVPKSDEIQEFGVSDKKSFSDMTKSIGFEETLDQNGVNLLVEDNKSIFNDAVKGDDGSFSRKQYTYKDVMDKYFDTVVKTGATDVSELSTSDMSMLTKEEKDFIKSANDHGFNSNFNLAFQKKANEIRAKELSDKAALAKELGDSKTSNKLLSESYSYKSKAEYISERIGDEKGYERYNDTVKKSQKYANDNGFNESNVVESALHLQRGYEALASIEQDNELNGEPFNKKQLSESKNKIKNILEKMGIDPENNLTIKKLSDEVKVNFATEFGVETELSSEALDKIKKEELYNSQIKVLSDKLNDSISKGDLKQADSIRKKIVQKKASKEPILLNGKADVIKIDPNSSIDFIQKEVDMAREILAEVDPSTQKGAQVQKNLEEYISDGENIIESKNQAKLAEEAEAKELKRKDDEYQGIDREYKQTQDLKSKYQEKIKKIEDGIKNKSFSDMEKANNAIRVYKKQIEIFDDVLLDKKAFSDANIDKLIKLEEDTGMPVNLPESMVEKRLASAKKEMITSEAKERNALDEKKAEAIDEFQSKFDIVDEDNLNKEREGKQELYEKLFADADKVKSLSETSSLNNEKKTLSETIKRDEAILKNIEESDAKKEVQKKIDADKKRLKEIDIEIENQKLQSPQTKQDIKELSERRGVEGLSPRIAKLQEKVNKAKALEDGLSKEILVKQAEKELALEKNKEILEKDKEQMGDMVRALEGAIEMESDSKKKEEIKKELESLTGKNYSKSDTKVVKADGKAKEDKTGETDIEQQSKEVLSQEIDKKQDLDTIKQQPKEVIQDEQVTKKSTKTGIDGVNRDGGDVPSKRGGKAIEKDAQVDETKETIESIKESEETLVGKLIELAKVGEQDSEDAIAIEDRLIDKYNISPSSIDKIISNATKANDNGRVNTLVEELRNLALRGEQDSSAAVKIEDELISKYGKSVDEIDSYIDGYIREKDESINIEKNEDIDSEDVIMYNVPDEVRRKAERSFGFAEKLVKDFNDKNADTYYSVSDITDKIDKEISALEELSSSQRKAIDRVPYEDTISTLTQIKNSLNTKKITPKGIVLGNRMNNSNIFRSTDIKQKRDSKQYTPRGILKKILIDGKVNTDKPLKISTDSLSNYVLSIYNDLVSSGKELTKSEKELLNLSEKLRSAKTVEDVRNIKGFKSQGNSGYSITGGNGKPINISINRGLRAKLVNSESEDNISLDKAIGDNITLLDTISSDYSHSYDDINETGYEYYGDPEYLEDYEYRKDVVGKKGTMLGDISNKAKEDILKDFGKAVDIIFKPMAEGEYGKVYFNEKTGKYGITINSNISDADALVTIAHELGHAFLPTLEAKNPKLAGELRQMYKDEVGKGSKLAKKIDKLYPDATEDQKYSEWVSRVVESSPLFKKNGEINRAYYEKNMESLPSKIYRKIKAMVYRFMSGISGGKITDKGARSVMADRIVSAMFKTGIKPIKSDTQYKVEEVRSSEKIKGYKGDQKEVSRGDLRSEFEKTTKDNKTLLNKIELDTIDDIETGTANKKLLNKVKELAGKFFEWSSNADTALNRMGFREGSRIRDIFVGSFNRGRKKADALWKRGHDYIINGLEDVGIKNFGDMERKSGNLYTTSVKDGEVKLSSMERVELYLHSKNEDSRKHLKNGGFKISKEGNSYAMTNESFDALENSLTENEKKAAKVFDNWFNSEAMKEFAVEYKKLNGEDFKAIEQYFPIRVADSDASDVNNFSALDETVDINAINKFYRASSNPSIAKSRSGNSERAIYLDGAMQAFKYHTRQTSQYVGFAEPTFNARQALGDLRGDFERAGFGTTWENLKKRNEMIDGTYKPSKVERGAKRLAGRLATASLGLRAFSALKQTTSATTASAEFTYASMPTVIAQLTKDIASNTISDKTIKEMEQHSPTLWRRSQGDIDEAVNMAMTDSRNKVMQTINKANMWAIQKMDSATIGAIWKASKREVESKGMKEGDKGYWEAVEDKTLDVIHNTQPEFNMENRTFVGMETILKPYAMFFSARSKTGQMVMKSIDDIFNGKNIDVAKKRLASALVLLPAALLGIEELRDEALQKKTAGEADKVADWKEYARNLTGMFAGLSIAGDVLLSKYGYRGDPLASGIADAGTVFTQLKNNNFDVEKVMSNEGNRRKIMRLVGLLTGQGVGGAQELYDLTVKNLGAE